MEQRSYADDGRRVSVSTLIMRYSLKCFDVPQLLYSEISWHVSSTFHIDPFFNNPPLV